MTWVFLHITWAGKLKYTPYLFLFKNTCTLIINTCTFIDKINIILWPAWSSRLMIESETVDLSCFL